MNEFNDDQLPASESLKQLAEAHEEDIRDQFQYLSYAPIIFVSLDIVQNIGELARNKLFDVLVGSVIV